jgi:monoamine oxidase
MASGIFIGLTEDELLAIKVQALADITAGKVLSSYSDSGSSATRSVTMTAKERLSEAMFALSRLDPQTYGTRKTVVSTNWSNPIDE